MIDFKDISQRLMGSGINEPKTLREIIRSVQNEREQLTQNEHFDKTIRMLLQGSVASDIDVETKVLLLTLMCALLNIIVDSESNEVIHQFVQILGSASKKFNVLSEPYVQFCNTRINCCQINCKCFQYCLIHGLFKSNFIKNRFLSEYRYAIVLKCFTILEKSCAEYTKLTFLNFKSLLSLLQTITEFKLWFLLDEETVHKVLFIINTNWENPMPGVRDVNLQIFKEIIKNVKQLKHCSLLDINILLLNVFTFLKWSNKSKYFILSEIVNVYGIDVIYENERYDFEDDINSGLSESLQGSAASSAGSTLFQVIWNTKTGRDKLEGIIWDILERREEGKIHNLFNYWVPYVAKKNPEIIFKFLNNLIASERLNRNKAEYQSYLYSISSLLKLCRKLGLAYKTFTENDLEITDNNGFNVRQFIEVCLKSHDEHVRSQAFEFVCVSAKTTLNPTSIEYDLIKEFMIDNINSDCTQLRQNIISSFTVFLIRIRDSNLSRIKDFLKNSVNGITEQYNELQSMVTFLNWLYDFLIENLTLNSNYQRKILSLKTFDIILRYFNGGVDKRENLIKGLCRKSNQKTQGIKIQQFLSTVDSWKFTSVESINVLLDCTSDPTNDIREQATDIIIQYFTAKYFTKDDMQKLFKKGLKMINSCLFYETECGALYIKIFSHLVKSADCNLEELVNCSYRKEITYRTTVNQLENDNEDIELTNMTLIELFVAIGEVQYNQMTHDLLSAVLTEKPLYGILSCINKLVQDESIKVDSELINKILSLIENTVEFCLKSLAIKASNADSKFSPSFSEMDMSIEYLIEISEMRHSAKTKTECNQLSNTHQIVLNCIWMSLKICSELASSLGILCLKGQVRGIDNLDESSELVLERCVEISVSVLMRCRHKGAIESTGVALGAIVSAITMYTPQSLLPNNVLRRSVFSTLCKDGKAPSVTRRGAGIGILLHKIVSADCRTDRPLLAESMNEFLAVLELNIKVQTINENDITKDITEACVLHYLKNLIQDSSLRANMSPYICRVVLVAFKHFLNPSWSVRNAALQLFGAVVPKLIGQKKGLSLAKNVKTEMELFKDVEVQDNEGMLHSKIDDIYIDVGELFVHLPELVEFMISYLERVARNSSVTKLIRNHSSLVPILTLLNGTRVGLSVLYSKKLYDTVQRFKNVFVTLLSSPIHVLRNLSSKAIVCFSSQYECDANVASMCLMIENSNSENFKHGAVLTLYYTIANNEFLINDNLNELIIRLAQYCDTCNNSYSLRSVYFQLRCLFIPYLPESMFTAIYHDFMSSIDSKFEDILHVGSKIGFELYVQSKCTLIQQRILNTKIIGVSADSTYMFDTLKACLYNKHPDLLKPVLKMYIQNRSLVQIDLQLENIFNMLIDFVLCKDWFSNDIQVLLIQLLHMCYKSKTFRISESEISLFIKKFIQKDAACSRNLCELAFPIFCALVYADNYESVSDCRKVDGVFIFRMETFIESASDTERFIAAQAINALSSFCCVNRNNALSVLIIDWITTLLQDENDEIRKEITKFYCNAQKYNDNSFNQYMINPSLCLRMYLNINFLKYLIDDHVVYELLSRKAAYLHAEMCSAKLKNNTEVINPFNHGVSNVFIENNMVLKMIRQAILMAGFQGVLNEN